MRAQRDFRGQWWLPGHRDESVGGVLSHHPTDGLELDVFDSLTDRESDLFSGGDGDEPTVIDRVFGITQDGDHVTLDTCQQTFERVAYGSEVIRPETFSVTRALIGDHFDDEIRFESTGMQLEALHKWFSRSGLNLEFEPDSNGTTDKQASEPVVSAQYTHPDPETITSADLTVHFDPGITVEREGSTSVRFSEATSVEVSPTQDEETIAFQRAQSVLRKLQLFIAFGLQEPVQPTEITGYYESDEEHPETQVEILTNNSAEATVSEAPHRQELLFLLPDIEEGLEPLLDTWLQSFDELAPVLNTYFKTIYDDPDLMTMYLLRRAALEAYYSTQIRATLSDDASPLHGDSSESQVEDDTLKALTGEDTDEPFAAQLTAILDRHSDTVSKLPDHLADRIAEAQSSIESLVEQPQNPSSALYQRTKSLAVICNLVILSELGLPPNEIATLVETR